MNNNFFYPLASNSWDNNEIAAIESVIAKQTYKMGEQVCIFENCFAKKFGSKYAVMVNSGSSANLLAIAALCYKSKNPLKAHDEIIVPSLSWPTTYYPVHQYNMKLVFVDIDKYTLNIDTEQLMLALSEKTKAVFVPHILGGVANIDELINFCRKHNLYLIEDNCESMGARYASKYAGTYGICGTFSMFFSHHISTMEGGVVVTDDEELYHIMLSLRAHGWTRDLPNKNSLCRKSAESFYEAFRFILPGYNLRPLEMEGAIGIEQLKKLNDFIVTRKENAEHFNALFAHDARFITQQEFADSSWFGFSLLLTDKVKMSRAEVVCLLTKSGIETRPIVCGNILKNDVIKHLNHRVIGEHKNAEYVHNYGFFVGNHHYRLQTELDHLYQVLSDVQ